MTKKNILRIVASIIMLGAVVAFVYWIFKGKGSDLTIENKEARCLNQPSENIPSSMPQRKPYDENFKHLSYKFPSWWTPQLGDTQSLLMPDTNTIYEKIVVSGENVWFTYSSESSLMRYDAQTNEIKPYSILNGEYKPFEVSDLYLARDGTLWISLVSMQPGEGYSALARYRPDKDDFEIIADQGGLFKLSQEGWAFGTSDKKLAELPDGQLVVVIDRKIYSYNPATNQAKLILDSGNVETIATGKDDNIWFMNYFKDYHLHSVSARTGKVVDYGVPPRLGEEIETQSELIGAIKAITIDQQGRVWVSYFDRLDPDSNGKYSWHSMGLPPVFVNTFDPYYAYRWANVFSTYSFSDGNIWFASDVGIVKYDIKSDTWCLSAEVKTFADYPIAEDAEGNIWTVADRQIYKLQK